MSNPTISDYSSIAKLFGPSSDYSLISSLSPSHPLYLHPSDDPGQVLVSEPFNGEGFDRWKRSMRIALSAKNKLEFIDGKMEKPSPDSPLYDQWIRCNDMVISWILNALIKDIAQTVIYTQTAHEIWIELEQRFGQANSEKLYQIQKAISGLSQGSLSIAAYYNKAKILWDELDNMDVTPVCTCEGCECGARASLMKSQENQKVIQFLIGLDDSYANARCYILKMSPLPSLMQVYSLLIQEEKERKSKTDSKLPSESASSDVPSKRQPFHKGKNEAKKPVRFCDFCGRQGHTIEKCFKLHGYPGSSKNIKGKKSDSESFVPGLPSHQSKQLIAQLHDMQIANNTEDSRASDHMVPSRMENSSRELPMELLTEVLARLPVKSLFQCRCVCKAWCSLISSPDFATLHLSCYNSDGDDVPFLTVMQILDDYLVGYWMLLSGRTYDREITNDDYQILDQRLIYSSHANDFYVHGTCVNGLVLWSRERYVSSDEAARTNNSSWWGCRSRDLYGNPPPDDVNFTSANTTYCKQRQIILWNPMIRKALGLPTDYPPFGDYDWPPHYGLGFSHSRNDYKVVAFVMDTETLQKSVHVYSLSTMTWREINECNIREDIINNVCSEGQHLIDGTIHFISINYKERKSHLVSFDVDSEMLSHVELPSELVLEELPSEYNQIYPVNYHEKIGILNLDKSNRLCDLWVMEKDGMKGPWRKLYAIGVECDVYRMLCFKKDGQFILKDTEGETLYDVELGKVKNIGISGQGHAMVYCSPYKGSLVLLREGIDWYC